MLEPGGDPLRFDDNGPVVQPAKMTTNAAVDSPKLAASRKRRLLILSEPIVVKGTI